MRPYLQQRRRAVFFFSCLTVFKKQGESFPAKWLGLTPDFHQSRVCIRRQNSDVCLLSSRHLAQPGNSSVDLETPPVCQDVGEQRTLPSQSFNFPQEYQHELHQIMHLPYSAEVLLQLSNVFCLFRELVILYQCIATRSAGAFLAYLTKPGALDGPGPSYLTCINASILGMGAGKWVVTRQTVKVVGNHESSCISPKHSRSSKSRVASGWCINA